METQNRGGVSGQGITLNLPYLGMETGPSMVPGLWPVCLNLPYLGMETERGQSVPRP